MRSDRGPRRGERARGGQRAQIGGHGGARPDEFVACPAWLEFSGLVVELEEVMREGREGGGEGGGACVEH